MQNVLNHISHRSDHISLTNAEKEFFSQARSVTAISYGVIREVLLFCLRLLEWKLKWFGLILWSQATKV